jgi:hypothetical protein
MLGPTSWCRNGPLLLAGSSSLDCLRCWSHLPHLLTFSPIVRHKLASKSLCCQSAAARTCRHAWPAAAHHMHWQPCDRLFLRPARSAMIRPGFRIHRWRPAGGSGYVREVIPCFYCYRPMVALLFLHSCSRLTSLFCTYMVIRTIPVADIQTMD